MGNVLKQEIILRAIDKVTKPLTNISGGTKKLTKEIEVTQNKIKEFGRQKIKIDAFKLLNNDLKKLEQSLVLAKQKQNQYKQAIDSVSSPSRKMQNDFTRSAIEVSKLSAKKTELIQKLKSSRIDLIASGVATNNLKKSEQNLIAETTRLNTVLAKQGEQLKKNARLAQQSQNIQNRFNKTMSASGKAAAGGGAMLGAGYMMSRPIMAALKDGMAFDESMSKVQSLTRLDKTSEQMKELREQARLLGATTLFTAQDVASGQGFLAMAGFTPDKIKDAMSGILDLAKAGGVGDLGVVADIGSNILTGMNLKASDMTHVSDVLVAAFTRSNTTVEGLGESMKYAAPKAAELGVSLETTAAMMAKLGDAGIQGSMAGTGVRRVLSRLAKPNASAAKAFKQLGLNISDATGNMRPVPDILEDIANKTKNMTDIQKSAVFTNIAGETGAGALSILSDKSGTGELQEFIKTLEGSQGEAGKVAGVMADNLGGDFEILKSAISDVNIELMESQSGGLRDFVTGASEAVGKVGAWMQKNPELTAQIVKVVGVITGLLVVFGGIALTVAAILAPFAMLQFSLNSLGLGAFKIISIFPKIGSAFLSVGKAFMMNPIAIAIAVAVAAIYLLWKNWDKVKAAVVAGWEWIKSAFADNPILNALFPVVPIIQMVIDNWDNLKTHLLAIWLMLQDAGKAVWDGIVAIFNMSPLGIIINNWGAIKNYLSKMWEGLKNIGKVVWDALIEVFKKSPLGIIIENWDAIKNTLKNINLREIGSQIVQKLIDGIKSKIEALKNVWANIKNMFSVGGAPVPPVGGGSAPSGGGGSVPPKVGGSQFLGGGGGGLSFISPSEANKAVSRKSGGGATYNNSYEINIPTNTNASAFDIGEAVREVLRQESARMLRQEAIDFSDGA